MQHQSGGHPKFWRERVQVKISLHSARTWARCLTADADPLHWQSPAGQSTKDWQLAHDGLHRAPTRAITRATYAALPQRELQLAGGLLSPCSHGADTTSLREPLENPVAGRKQPRMHFVNTHHLAPRCLYDSNRACAPGQRRGVQMLAA